MIHNPAALAEFTQNELDLLNPLLIRYQVSQVCTCILLQGDRLSEYLSEEAMKEMKDTFQRLQGDRYILFVFAFCFLVLKAMTEFPLKTVES